MARTYRRKRGDLTELKYYFQDYIYSFDDKDLSKYESIKIRRNGFYFDSGSQEYLRATSYEVTYSKYSKEGKKGLAQYHKDGSKAHWRGPSWFLREFCQVPYRTRAKRAIHNYLRYDEDIVLESKPKRDYWD